MTKHDVQHILDGTDPKFGPSMALFLNGLIIVSALVIAVESMPQISDGLRRVFFGFEAVILVIFVGEYILRIVTAPKPWRYIFSFWGIVDLLAILPALVLLQPEWAAIRTFRLIRLVRLLKLFRSSRALDRMVHAFQAVRGELTVLIIMAVMMLYVSAVGIYIFEHPEQPEVFTSIPQSFWWAVASLTTVGYGDMVPITIGGRIFTTMVLFVGLGVVAGPAAIITTALLETELEDAGFDLHDANETPDTNQKTDRENVT